jgi:hypothetical protein
MPAAGAKQQRSEPVDLTAMADRQIMPGAVLSDFEQICVAIPASGAVVAVRDRAGLYCTVSFGNAPAVSSRLPTDSLFTRQCVETAEVVLCEDTQGDPTISSLATRWNFRSSVAVPIQIRGSVVALIEVFSSQPRGIRPAAIAGLKAVAQSFAALLLFDASDYGQPLVGGSLDRPTILPSPIVDEQQNSVAEQALTLIAPEEPAIIAEEEFVTIVNPGPAPEKINRDEVRRTAVAPSKLLSDRPMPTRVWLIAAALLFLLSLLFLFLFRSANAI